MFNRRKSVTVVHARREFKYLVVLIVALLLSACNPREFPPFKKFSEWSEKEATRQIEEAIKNDPELAELDSVCKQVPVPEDFKFIWKGGLDDQKVSFSTYYFSHIRYEDARRIWDDYFHRNDWKLVGRKEGRISKVSEFRNASYRVIIQFGGMGKSVNYSIYCEKLNG